MIRAFSIDPEEAQIGRLLPARGRLSQRAHEGVRGPHNGVHVEDLIERQMPSRSVPLGTLGGGTRIRCTT